MKTKNLSIIIVMILLCISLLFLCSCYQETCEHSLKFIGLNSTSSSQQVGVFKCEKCHSIVHDNLKHEDIQMPILNFNGDISQMSKENKVTVSVSYQDANQTFECDGTLKWQGATSLSFPKKNFTLQLLEKGSTKKNKIQLIEEWGKQSKYCLKANYVDFSQSRNVVAGQIFNDIVHSREIQDEFTALTNGGVVDGYPVLIIVNNTYQGLYTLNIPKDKWMFGMSDDKETDDTITKQAIIQSDDWIGTDLKAPINPDYNSSGFELEYCSTEETVGDT